MTHETLKDILNLCRWAPSGDNCQPWSFSWDGKTLNIIHDKKLAEHDLNQNFFSSAISLGSFYTYLEVAAENWGFKPLLTEKSLLPSGEMFLKFEFESCTQNKPELFSALTTRHTDRRTFNGKAVPSEILKKIEALNKSDSLCKVSTSAIPEGRLFQYIYSSDQFLWSSMPQTVRDLLNLIHFNMKSAMTSKRGLYWKGLSAPLPTIFTLWLMKISNLAQKIFSSIIAIIAPQITKQLLQSSGALLFYSLKEPTLAAVFDCGRLSAQAWLYLESKNISSQPVSICCLPLLDLALKPSFFSDKPKLQKHFLAGKDLLLSHLNCSPQEYPVWMFRVGYATSPYPNEARTLRVDVEDLLAHN